MCAFKFKRHPKLKVCITAPLLSALRLQRRRWTSRLFFLYNGHMSHRIDLTWRNAQGYTQRWACMLINRPFSPLFCKTKLRRDSPAGWMTHRPESPSELQEKRWSWAIRRLIEVLERQRFYGSENHLTACFKTFALTQTVSGLKCMRGF